MNAQATTTGLRTSPNAPRITLASLAEIKRAGTKFSMLTCYDAILAHWIEAAGVEVLLVGDTAAEVVLGLAGTRDMPVEFLLTLTAAVRRGAPSSLVMGDLPHACRCEGPDVTVRWARRFIDEPGCDALKVEVNSDEVPLVEAMTSAGVPVVAHIGLLPQQVDSTAGYRAQGKDAASAAQLIQDAQRFEKAGAKALLLEAVASEVAREIATRTALPVIGCVSGPHCDGTVVVLHDMLGLGGGHPPRGVKRYLRLGEQLQAVFARYVGDIHAGRFPTEDDVVHMAPGEFEKLQAQFGKA